MTAKRYNKLSTVHRQLAFEAVDFFVDKMMPRLRNKLTIRIKGDTELLQREGIYADCVDDDDDYENRNPRSFVIRVDTTVSLERFLATIMHELVHVKQFARGELRYVERGVGTHRWQSKSLDANKLDYYDLPWEIEAHGREKGLTVQFLTKNPEWWEMVGDIQE